MTYQDKTIYRCTHCGSRCGKGASYCKSCATARMRKDMDEENKKINPNFVCRQCEMGWYSVFTEKFEKVEDEETAKA